ncbi:Hypothetical protein CINCED_3A012697 [Cinara cedri]|uniref:MD-2-related lipid-recognition domain-containing protein n=1 Tax=Cinara cedri TaxID=506608 RepID=A0A5E4N0X1_9HEMI|nr:Hypothetical protein CINCED_3A012697 [Cinara cedri]
MKIQLYVIVRILEICIVFGSQGVKNKNGFFPNLPAGPYIPKLEAIRPIQNTANHSVALNIYLSRKSLNITYIMGNITLKTQFDDTFWVDYNMASRSSMGGWKDNAYFLKCFNACSTARSLMGNMWNSLTKAFNATNKCPVPAGTYISSGMNIYDVGDNNFPKTFFYGRYKVTVKVLNKNNDYVGGFISFMNILRPWETDT